MQKQKKVTNTKAADELFERVFDLIHEYDPLKVIAGVAEHALLTSESEQTHCVACSAMAFHLHLELAGVLQRMLDLESVFSVLRDIQASNSASRLTKTPNEKIDMSDTTAAVERPRFLNRKEIHQRVAILLQDIGAPIEAKPCPHSRNEFLSVLEALSSIAKCYANWDDNDCSRFDRRNLRLIHCELELMMARVLELTALDGEEEEA